MGPKERIFNFEYGQELLSIAHGDYESAKELYLGTKGRKENIIYIAQQAIEKAIKAVLVHKKLPVPHTHDILVLLTKLQPSEYPPGGINLSDLTPFATIRRYENGVYELTKEEIDTALKAAKDVLGWAKIKLSSS